MSDTNVGAARDRAVLQDGLVENTEQGLALTSRDVARGELLRTRLWQRVREFLATRPYVPRDAVRTLSEHR